MPRARRLRELDAGGGARDGRVGRGERRHGREAGGVPRGGASRGPRRADRRRTDARGPARGPRRQRRRDRGHGCNGDDDDGDDQLRYPGARSAPRTADLQAAAGGVRARRRERIEDVEGRRVSRLRVGHRGDGARARPPRACRARSPIRRRAAPHLEPVLPSAAGPGGGAARGLLGVAARVLLQQRHRGDGGVPEVRPPLLVHAGRPRGRGSWPSSTGFPGGRWARSR